LRWYRFAKPVNATYTEPVNATYTEPVNATSTEESTEPTKGPPKDKSEPKGKAK